MADMITLVLPQGAYDIPPAHGGFAFLPERLNPSQTSGPTVLNPSDQVDWGYCIPAVDPE